MLKGQISDLENAVDSKHIHTHTHTHIMGGIP